MDCELSLRVVLASGATIRDRQVVVNDGVFGLELHRFFERRYCFGELLGAQQGYSQAKICAAKSGIQLDGPDKVLDGYWPLILLTRQFSQDVFSASILGIDF